MKHKILDHGEWTEARKTLLAREKEFTKLRDQITMERQQLPWEKLEKNYVFDSPNGPVSLEDLFDGRSQLITYHFMYAPDWDTGCKSCSFLADHFNPAIVHLNHRDVSFVVVSKAPIDVLEAYRKRMGWDFLWVSALNSDFNEDYHVSFSEEQMASGNAEHNYRNRGFPASEAPGASVFFKDDDGTVYHTYSVYERGLDMFITAYHYLDIVPKGRDEHGNNMGWLRRHDEYDT